MQLHRFKMQADAYKFQCGVFCNVDAILEVVTLIDQLALNEETLFPLGFAHGALAVQQQAQEAPQLTALGSQSKKTRKNKSKELEIKKTNTSNVSLENIRR